MYYTFLSYLLILSLAGSQEQSNEENFELHVVSYEEFEAFVNAPAMLLMLKNMGGHLFSKMSTISRS